MTNNDHTKPATMQTPGTWTLSHDAEGVFTIHAKGTNKAPARIAIVTSFKDDLAEISEVEAEANASLIAAAPAQRIVLDLLQLGLATIAEGELEFDGVMYWFDHRCPHWAAAVVDAIGWDHARAAIAEATPA